MVDEVKQPLNLIKLSYSDLRLLSVYLHLKSIASSGTLTKSQIRSVWYWKGKLINRGLLKLDKSGSHYTIRRYVAAWRAFGLEKKLSKTKLINRVWCVKILFKTRQEILKRLMSYKAETLAKQIRYARSTWRPKSGKRKKIEVPLSCATVSKFFGYKALSSGSKVRKKQFKVVGPLEKHMIYLPDVNKHEMVCRYKTRIVRI